jgi:hypothetical protein
MRVCRAFRDVQLNKFNLKLINRASTHSKFVRKVSGFLTIVEMNSLNMDIQLPACACLVIYRRGERGGGSDASI